MESMALIRSTCCSPSFTHLPYKYKFFFLTRIKCHSEKSSLSTLFTVAPTHSSYFIFITATQVAPWLLYACGTILSNRLFIYLLSIFPNNVTAVAMENLSALFSATILSPGTVSNILCIR